LQERISVFQNGIFNRKKQKQLSLKVGYFMKRWEVKCKGEKYRGGDEVYGESIYTKRWELLEPMNCLR
jgi:outer membrane receptor for ferrienterochelin and colicins